MDSHGHPPPYNPWDPPPPPLPPSDFHWGGPDPAAFYGPPPHFPNADIDADGGFGHPMPHFSRKRKFDRPDINAAHAKLYVGPVPNYVSQHQVSHVFEEFGNVVEVVLLNDKKTGQQQEFCFVKYASVAEAEGAITALHNQFTFPGTMCPLKVKYADGERKRLGLDHAMPHNSSLSRPVTHSVGLVQHDSTFSGPVFAETGHKVYVNGLNREASKEEIAEIFSSYGVVADIYIMRDDSKRSRGCGFVGFSQRCMAMAAINGLNGAYVMRGCDKPLIVRFADPKKPKNGDFRPPPHPVDVRRNNVSDALQLGPSMCTKLSSTEVQTGINCSVANQLRHPPHEMHQMPTEKPFSPSRLSQMSLLESQTLQASIDAEVNSTMMSTEHGSWTSSGIDYSEVFGECDWSEHICPDGNKYYFNRVTSESSWEKPEEFALCERRIERQKSQDQSCKEPRTSNVVAPPSEEDQIEAAQYESKSRDFEKPQSTLSCAVEHSHEIAADEPSSVGEPAFVQ
ncbi:hypothetical protein RND81_02G002200 [Saponaria officinalis]|uniref:Flowering time control protein FCA n=1 Tax=Saponaria officinalis TaxID=3572 RepID=A0AAW1MS73_SAPOF